MDRIIFNQIDRIMNAAEHAYERLKVTEEFKFNRLGKELIDAFPLSNNVDEFDFHEVISFYENDFGFTLNTSRDSLIERIKHTLKICRQPDSKITEVWNSFEQLENFLEENIVFNSTAE